MAVDKKEQTTVGEIAESIKRLNATELHGLCENLVDDHIGYRLKIHLDVLIQAKEVERDDLQN